MWEINLVAKRIPLKIKRNPRFLALQAIKEVFNGAAYSNLLLGEIIDSTELSDKDRRLFTEIVYGTIARKLTLEFYVERNVRNPKKLDDWVKYLLMLSVYQMIYLDKIPNHAILNDAVEIAKSYGNVGIGKFVNGVLRNISRNGVPEFSTIKNSLTRKSIQYSVPEWMYKQFEKQYGVKRADAIFESLFIKSKSSIRVNTAKTERSSVQEKLLQDGVETINSQISSVGLVSEKGFLAGNQLFEAGFYTIQDESSQLVAPILDAQPNDLILDACAAPGGKTTHIATYLSNGKITALDLYDHKLRLIKENAQRLGISDKIELEKFDAREIGKHFAKEYFDRILVDAPCSGLGLIRRKPDIKYSKSSEDFEALQKIQLDILESCAQVLKKSGIMVYSTCTIIDIENQKVIQMFLEKHSEFEMLNIESDVDIVSEGQIVITPEMHQTDGFFVCKLKKK